MLEQAEAKLAAELKRAPAVRLSQERAAATLPAQALRTLARAARRGLIVRGMRAAAAAEQRPNPVRHAANAERTFAMPTK